MQKSLALVAVASFAVILAATIAMAATMASESATGATPADEITIPLGRDVNLSNNLTIHILQVTVSNVTYGGAYSADPANSTWPVLLFQYKNYGEAQLPGRIHVQFVDNASTVYEKKDVYNGGPIYPNQTSPLQTVEVAMPKNRVLSEIVIVDEWTKEKTVIPVVYPAPVASVTPAPAPLAFVDDSSRNLLIIPIILVVIGLIGWFMARRRLF